MPEGYTPGGGLSAGWQPKLTPQQGAENEARKALYLHTKSFYIDDKGLAKGRWVEDEQDRMAREQAAMDRPTPEARMEALRQIMLDPAEMERTANIALSFGPGVIQELRDPAKLAFSKGYREAQAQGTHGKFLFDEMYKNKKVLDQVVENQGLNPPQPPFMNDARREAVNKWLKRSRVMPKGAENVVIGDDSVGWTVEGRPEWRAYPRHIYDVGIGEEAPGYKLTLYRGGRGQTAPGRGIYHTPDPSEAAIYEHFRRTGKEIQTQGDLDHALKRVDAKTVELKKPFVQRRASTIAGDDNPEDPFGLADEVETVIQNLSLKGKEAKTVRSLSAAMLRGTPVSEGRKGMFPNEQPQLRYERYITRLAKNRGYDSVVYHTPEMEHYEVVLPDE